MVHEALEMLKEGDVVTLDEERKAAGKMAVAGLALGAGAGLAMRTDCVPVITAALTLAATRTFALLRAAALTAVAALTGETARRLLERLLTRVLDWGVPTFAIGLLLSGLKGPPPADAPQGRGLPFWKRGGVERGGAVCSRDLGTEVRL